MLCSLTVTKMTLFSIIHFILCYHWFTLTLEIFQAWAALQVWMNRARSFFILIYFSFWLFLLGGLFMPSLHYLVFNIFSLPRKEWEKALSFSSSTLLHDFKAKTAGELKGWREKVSTRFGLDDACCPWGNEGGWTWQSTSAKCCLVPAPCVEKSSFCNGFPEEMAQERLHTLITGQKLLKCQSERAAGRGADCKEGEDRHCWEGKPSWF